jgi:hypothetical protein
MGKTYNPPFEEVEIMQKMEKTGYMVLVVTAALCVYGQPPDTLWSRVYGSTDCIPFCPEEVGTGIVQKPDGNFVLCGYGVVKNGSLVQDNAWVWEIDSSGKLVWSKMYGGQYSEMAVSINRTRNNGFIVGARTNSFGAGETDIWLLCLDSTGDTLWTKTYGDFHANDVSEVVQTKDGGYAIGGFSQSISNGLKSNAWLIRTDSTGDTIWSKIWDSMGPITSLKQTDDGGFVFVDGESIMRTDSLGDSLWSTPVDGFNVISCSDETFAVAGRYSITKINYNGTLKWNGLYPYIDLNGSHLLHETYDHGFIVAGTEMDGRSGVLLRINSAGDLKWKTNIESPISAEFRSMCMTPDSGFIAVGATNGFNARGVDAWAVRFGKDTGSAVSILNSKKNSGRSDVKSWYILRNKRRLQLIQRNENGSFRDINPSLFSLSGRKTGSFIRGGPGIFILNRAGIPGGLYYCVIESPFCAKVAIPVLVE